MQFVNDTNNNRLSFSSIVCSETKLRFECVTGIHVIHKFPMHLHNESLCIGMVTRGKRSMLFTDKEEIICKNEVFVINTCQPHAIKQDTPHDYRIITIKKVIPTVAFENKIQSDICPDIFQSLFKSIERKDFHAIPDQWNHLYDYLFLNHLTTSLSFTQKQPIIKAIDFIKKNHQNPISIHDIARQACLSTYHFCRLFKEAVGFAT